ncbi:proline-rich protein PRCC [Manduca sexta]|uniref:Proline-rich protein PRCC n=1 Tax=Manduca sexta TaxID=7130 RepID=A0A921ZBJ7_MANSE|nr:proline-rich protein PRCC [Manduca sexta]KAG6454948.1 hypothetical protein O3G_MSEX008940 [Manduca sexta]
MALVAYDNSDSSEFEDDDETTNNPTIHKEVGESGIIETVATPARQTTESAPSIEGSNLFNLLPQPSTKKPQVIEEDDEFLHKKETVSNVVKPKAKITVPSLSDFKDVESSIPAAKPRVASGKKSGLLSILPQPRNGVKATANSFLPYALTQKTNNANVKKKEPLPSLVKKPKVDPKSIINEYSDESDNEGMENDFFSINKPVDIAVDDIPLDIDQNINKPNNIINERKPFNIETYFKPNNDESNIEPSDAYVTSSTEYAEASSSSNGYGQAEANSSEAVLDDEAIRKLCGARGKRRREDIEIVDVNQQEILADAREMLLRGLMDDTTKRVSVSKKKGNEPTSQQKRKHQITYLAHQAKANEADLQNQWANNRMSKRQTQSKYGF